jgi:hypothetical protein
MRIAVYENEAGLNQIETDGTFVYAAFMLQPPTGAIEPRESFLRPRYDEHWDIGLLVRHLLC